MLRWRGDSSKSRMRGRIADPSATVIFPDCGEDPPDFDLTEKDADYVLRKGVLSLREKGMPFTGLLRS